MAEKKEKTLLLALFDCFQKLASGVAYFDEDSDRCEYVEKLWAKQAENWYIVYCGDICVLCRGKMSDKVPVAFAQNTMAGKVTTANQAILRDKLWPKLSGKTFEILARKQEQHLKVLIERGVQLYNSKDNESKRKVDSGNSFSPHKNTTCRVWDYEKLIPLDHLEIQLDEQYEYVLQLFFDEPVDLICKDKELAFFCEIISDKEKKYSHEQILALYTGALILGLNISEEEKIRKPINKNIEDYLRNHFKDEKTEKKQTISENKAEKGKIAFKLKRFNPQTDLIFGEKKKSQNAIYIEEMIDKLINADVDDDTSDIYDRIKSRVDVVVEGVMNAALAEGFNYSELDRFMSSIQEEILQLIPEAEHKVNVRKQDPIMELKHNMIAALRIYIIIRFLQLCMSYGALLLSQASDQIEKESSKIKEDFELKKSAIYDSWAKQLEDKENDIEAIMVNVYGGNIV